MAYTYKNTNNIVLPYKMSDMEVFFSDLSCVDIIAAVLDENGNIRNFPGIETDERWQKKHNIGQCYDVRFEAQFYPVNDNKFLMLWMVQPNGWHWVDEDGFGFSGDSQIMLYSLTDSNGNFEERFRLYSIDNEVFCHEFDKYVKPV